MKKYVLDFLHRGFVACGLGPIVLAIFYIVLQEASGTVTLTVKEVVVGIFSLLALAFIAGGMNFLYKIEKMPLAAAILLHGGTLYIGYLITYLVNGWLAWGIIPIIVFSGIFVFGYVIIWITIYFAVKRNTNKINEALLHKNEEVK